MQANFSPSVQKQILELNRRDNKLVSKIRKQISLFELDALHPSLRLHKLSGHQEDVWSISIDRNFRMLYYQIGKDAYFFDLGTHDQVYKK